MNMQKFSTRQMFENLSAQKNESFLKSRDFRLIFTAFSLLLVIAAILAIVRPGSLRAAGPGKGAVSLNTAPFARVSLMALPAQQEGTALSLVKVRQAPDENSRVINLINPTQKVSVLGRSDEGSFIALGDESGNVTGWAPAGQIKIPAARAQARTLAKVYQAADTSSQVVDLLVPTQPITLVGSTPGGQFYAVAGAAGWEPVKGYVVARDVQTEYRTARSRSLGKVYRSANTGSLVVTVLTPSQPFELLGRSEAGDWVAVIVTGREIFSGWMQAGDIETSDALQNLPVLPAR